MILVLGGTVDGRRLAESLAETGTKVLLTVTTPLAQSLVKGNFPVRVGKLTHHEMELLIVERGITAVVDATHPFAQEISNTALAVSGDHNLPYFRLERPEIIYPEGTIFVENFERVADVIPKGEKVFVAIGIKHLDVFLKAGDFEPGQVYARVLPSSAANCLSLGLPEKNIIIGLGPFTIKQNLSHFRDSGAKWLITKASGAIGGEEEKIKAAKKLGMKAVVVTRPPSLGNKYHTIEDIISELRKEV